MKVIKATFQEIHDAPDESCCPRCAKINSRVWTAVRFAIDASKERHGLLKVVIGVYQCAPCRRFYRSNPKFIKPRHLYTNRIVNAAVAAAIEDKMPVSRIPHRLERDFGVRPTESVIQDWITKAARNIAEEDVLPVAVKEFSGILCVDEAYSGKLAIVVAVDPKRGDRLVGFDLSDSGIDKDRVKVFFEKLKKAGISPKQVVTDGSALYPEVVKDVWCGVNHQLCLFHATQRLTDLAKKSIRDLRKELPKPPKRKSGYAGRSEVVAALVMFKAGTSVRRIAKKLSVSRNSVKAWIKKPDFVADRYGVDIASLAAVSNGAGEDAYQEKEQKTGHIKRPPAGWRSWDEVDAVSTALKKLAFQISSRKLESTPALADLFNSCLASPVGSDLREMRQFIAAWYDLFADPASASEKWHQLKLRTLPPSCSRFKKFQKQMNAAFFEKLSTSLKDEAFESTSNGAERFARKIKRIQKSRYRLRTEKSLRDFIVLERILHENGITYDKMELADPFALTTA